MTDNLPSLGDGIPQYGLLKIVSIWACAALPMPVLAFVAAPNMAGYFHADLHLCVWLAMILGMIWQFILSIALLAQEVPDWRWATLKSRLWLEAPSEPASGRKNYALFWWLVPAFGAYALIELSPVERWIGHFVLLGLPQLDYLPLLSLTDLARPEYVGAWWLMGVAIISCIFNYFLGEELLFRGILLPRMRAAFGRWDWVANSVLFALYHLHRPVQMFAFILGGLAWSWPSRRFKCVWFAVILHALEGVLVLGGVFALVSGMMLN